jgi:hypothetical protein
MVVAYPSNNGRRERVALYFYMKPTNTRSVAQAPGE